jgi:hypothetical protein
MSDVLKLPTFNFPSAHQACRQTSLQGLNVGLLIQRQDDLITFKEPIHPFVEPQNARCPLPELIVQDRGLPVSRAMRLQRSRAQNQRDSRMRNPRHDASLNGYARQRPCRPMRYVQADARRSTTGQLLNPDPFQGGKSPTVDRTVERQRSHRSRFLHNADTMPRWQHELVPLDRLIAVPLFQAGTLRVKFAPAALLVVRSDRHVLFVPTGHDLLGSTQSHLEDVVSYFYISLGIVSV